MAKITGTKIIVDIEKLEIKNRKFIVTVYNRGNLGSNNTKIKIYKTTIQLNNAIPKLNLVASKTVTLGIKERKIITISPQNKIEGINNHYAIGYDPLHDSFPIISKENYTWSENNIMLNSNRLGNLLNFFDSTYNLDLWHQYTFQSSSFQSGSIVNPKTWQIIKTGEHINDEIKSYFCPKNTPSNFSELNREIEVNSIDPNPTLMKEISKGNVDIHASCFIKTSSVNPRDQGSFRLRILHKRNGQENELINLENPLFSSNVWKKVKFEVKGQKSFNCIQARFLAKKNNGVENDVFFSKLDIKLKHRQIAKCKGSFKKQPFDN